jgi:hypothetical protein
MSIIENNGSIFILGKVINNVSNGLENKGDIYLGVESELNNENYKISPNIENIPITLETYDQQLKPSNHWYGSDPNSFGNIWHPGNLSDFKIISHTIDISDLITININVQNIGGKKTDGYKLGDQIFDYHALYELSTSEIPSVEGISYDKDIKFIISDTTYWLKKYIRARDIIEKTGNSYQYTSIINSKYQTIVNDNLQEGILTTPNLECADIMDIRIILNKGKLMNFLESGIGNNVNLLFISDDPYYHLTGDTEEIIDTDLLNNNNIQILNITF